MGAKGRTKGITRRGRRAARTRAQPPSPRRQRAPPVAGTVAHQNLQVVPSGRAPARREVGAVAFPSASPWSAHSRAKLPPTLSPEPTWECPCLGARARARDHRPRRSHLCGAPPLPAVSPAAPSCQAGPTPSLGTWSVATNTLGPAQCPRKRGSSAKPRPASPLFTGTVGSCPAGPPPPPSYHPPRALKATLDSPQSALPPAGTCPRRGCAGPVVRGDPRSPTQGTVSLVGLRRAQVGIPELPPPVWLCYLGRVP